METSIANTTTTQLDSAIEDYSVNPETTDISFDQKEYRWHYSDFTEYLGYYKKIPELKKAIDALANWTVGKGIDTSPRDGFTLDVFNGIGRDTFLSIMWNLFTMKKVGGDAFAEIIRRDNTDRTSPILNLKPLSPERMVTIFGPNGRIIRYEQISGKKTKKFQPHQIFHLINDRVADEIHGTSVIEACKWVIDARNEAMNDWRRISHRSTIRIMYVDIENATRLGTLREQYKEGIKNGEVLILPGKKGTDVDFEDLALPPHEAFMRWIQYLENFFYQAVGVPRVIATSENYTEAASKVGYLTFEPVYTKEQTFLEHEIKKQLKIDVTFLRPPSLTSNMQRDEAANTGQTQIQPNDTQVNFTDG